MKSPSLVVSWFIILLFPLYSFPWVVYRMYHLERTSYLQFAFFMGLVGMLYPPFGDFYRYMLDYNAYKGLDFDSFLLLALIEFDYLLSFLLYDLGCLNIPCDISRFIFNAFGFYLYSKLYYHIVNDNQALLKGKERLRWFIVFFSFSFWGFMFRYGLATILFAYGTYFIIYRSQKRYWFLIILSVLCHFSFVIFATALLVSRFIHFSPKRNYFYIISALVLIFGIVNNGVFWDLKLIGGDLIDRYDGYLDADDMGEYAKRFSWKALVWQKIGYMTMFLLYCYYASYKVMGRRREVTLLNYLVIFSMLSSPFSVIFGRFFGVTSQFLKIFSMLHFNCGFVKARRYLSLLFILAMISLLTQFWGKRRELSVSDMSLFATQTSVQILFHTYPDTWVDKNVRADGGVLKYDD